MWTELHWVDGPWPGRIALAARPRGGDWLEEELRHWRSAGIDAVVSLLTPDEERELNLEAETEEAANAGLAYWSLPIPDRDVPPSETRFTAVLETVKSALSSGQNVAIHCRQGVGRTGLLAASLLVSEGQSAEAAVEKVSAARGVPVPETEAQRAWIDRLADRRAKSQPGRKRRSRAA